MFTQPTLRLKPPEVRAVFFGESFKSLETLMTAASLFRYQRLDALCSSGVGCHHFFGPMLVR